MAIIYSYPTVNPERTDLILGTDVSTSNKATKNFTVQSIIDLVTVATGDLQTVLDLGNVATGRDINLTDNSFRGASFITTTGGTISGTTINAGTLTGTASLDALNVGIGGLGVNGTVNLAGNTLTQVGQLNATRIDVSTDMDADGWTSGDDFRGNGGTVNLYRNFSSLGIRVVGAGSGAYLYGFNSSGGSYAIYNPFSDERLKENITDLGYGLNEINQLRPITYDWKDDVRPFPENTEVQYGLLAQELEEVMPELVDTAPNTHIVTDKEGNETEEELGIMVDGQFVQNTKSYAERPLIYILINAVQELTARVEALEA